MLVERKKPNKMKREGDFLLNRWEVAEAANQNPSELGENLDTKERISNPKTATSNFISRVEAAVAEKAEEISAAPRGGGHRRTRASAGSFTRDAAMAIYSPKEKKAFTTP